jgi:threonine/homoserine/homoserine lactone efflux protein
MDIRLLLKGLIIGFSIAAPVGPIGVLCIRRTLAQGRACGLVTGLGAATADAFYGSIAAFGLTFISTALVNQQAWLRIVGGAFLVYLGARTFFARPAERTEPAREGGLWAAFGSTFFLTLTNPMTILSFAAVFAGLGAVGASGGYASAGLLVAGVFAGSSFWWLLLSGGTGLLRSRIGGGALRWVNRVSGGVIAGFGLVALASVVLG